jgi:hypothetical protein
MEDYIFLIIAIVLSIFGAINKKKKITDNANPLAVKAQRTKNFFLDQLLGENFPDDSPEIIKPLVREKPVPKTVPTAAPRPVSQSGLYHFGFKSTLPEQKIKPFQTITPKSEVKEPENEFDETDSPSYLEDFSLRKAFVYSEIMQRKY